MSAGFGRVLGRLVRGIRLAVSPEDAGAGTQAVQRLLALQYRELLAKPSSRPSLADFGFRVFSQTDEDGILLFLFTAIGTTRKVFVEIGAGRGIECNGANLAIHQGWHGLFIDGDRRKAAWGAGFYSRHPDTRLFPPVFVSARVNRENVNALIRQAGFQGEIDLLSLDIDGMEYWIWEALDAVNPRAIVVEVNAKFGMRSLTVPYDADWVYDAKAHPHYNGASLPAMTKLAARKGYRLVGSNRFGFNAFYVRNDVAPDVLPAVPVESCRTHPVREQDEAIFERIRHLPFTTV